MSGYKLLADADVKGKTVLVRADFDVPFEDDEIRDNTKVRATAETIEFLMKKDCKVVVMSHLGNPDGEDDDLSLLPLRFELGNLIQNPVKFAHIHACENSIKFMEPGEVLMLENLKFKSPEIKGKDEEKHELFSVLIELCDLYVFEATGTEMNLASVSYLPSKMESYLGINAAKDIEMLTSVKEQFEKPFVAVLGGNDYDNKLALFEFVLDKADTVLLGGPLAYTFLKAQETNVGDSEMSEDHVSKAKKLISKAKKVGVEILYPFDHFVSSEKEDEDSMEEVETQHFKKGIAVDLGQKSLASYREVIESAKSVLWDGEVGYFRYESYNRGTEAIGEYIGLSAPRDAFKLALGAGTLEAIENLKIKAKRFTHISTAGENALTYMQGEHTEFLKPFKA